MDFGNHFACLENSLKKNDANPETGRWSWQLPAEPLHGGRQLVNGRLCQVCPLKINTKLLPGTLPFCLRPDVWVTYLCWEKQRMVITSLGIRVRQSHGHWPAETVISHIDSLSLASFTWQGRTNGKCTNGGVYSILFLHVMNSIIYKLEGKNGVKQYHVVSSSVLSG